MNTLKQRFIELFKASGWTQAETARRMDMTRGGVNGVVTGPNAPSAASVHFLEMLMLQEGIRVPGRDRSEVPGGKPEESSAYCGAAEELTSKLREINERAPNKFEAVKMIINSFHSQLKIKPKRINWSTKRARKRPSGKGAASARKPAAGSAA
jgi:transcriptional regulator with XRE-family HTH domain